MSAIFLILLLIILFSALLFLIPAKLIFAFESKSMSLDLTLLWLKPFLRSVVIYDGTKPILEVFLFNRSIYKKMLKPERRGLNLMEVNKIKLVRSARLSGVEVQATYGFLDPSATGIAYGIIGIISQFIDIDFLDCRPDFLPDEGYVYVHALAKLNIGLTLVSLIRAYNNDSTKQLSYQNR